ncbi:hypothetical protein [Pseudomonas silesiensis]|uniref:hypothetical protein n=1 Tax=Pseudomonas silesiensis TaxID=1853130 RepID=UPI0034D6C63B
MAKGDKVTLQWHGFDRNGVPRPFNPVWEVTDAQVGRPLTRLVERSRVLLISGGRLELSYRIDYAGGGEPSVSALQTLQILAPALPRLPELAIDGHGAGPIDPVRFPEGVTLRVALHPQARVGDTVLVNATVSTGTNAAVSVRLDPSTFDSGTLTLQLEHSWLVANNRKNAELTYQYARPGSVLSGEPLRLLIRQPLDIPMPSLEDAVPEPSDEPNEGRMNAADTTSGSRASVRPEAIVDEADTIHLYWGEPGTAGHSVVTTPVAGNWRAFDIPKNAIAMNMGAGVNSRERLKVFWRVVPNGEPTKRSTASIAGSAAGIAATYNYDLQNARLDWSEESGLKLSRTYYSTGEIRSETREQPGHEPATMEYHYSRQARLLKYVDVLEQDQVYDYKKSSGQLMGTRLGTTAATFAYNAQGQTERIETTDGPLSLKIKLTYDDQGREILREFDFGEGRTQQLSQAYNVVDQLIHRALTEGETVLRDETYDYDARGRLQLYICTGTQQPLDPYNKPIDMQIFIFDELDNLIQVQTTSPDGTNFAEYSYDNPLDPTQLSTVLNDHEDYLPKEIKLVYNDDGDMVSDEAGRTLGYDDLGRLISVSGLPGETPSGYTYDPLDVLASQSSGTDQQRRFYRDGEIHTLQQGSNSSTFMQADGRVLAEHQEGAGPKS